MVRLLKTIGKTIDTNGWDRKNHWKTIDANDSHVKKPLKNHWHQWFTCKKNHWKTIDYDGTLAKTINHSIVVKILPSLRSNCLDDTDCWASFRDLIPGRNNHEKGEMQIPIIDVFDRKSQKLIHRLEGHEYGGQTVQILGQILYSGSKDCTFRTWDLKNQTETE